MWIKMNETYVGGIGTFEKSKKYNLPTRLLKCIPEFIPQADHKDKPSRRKYYEPTYPPPDKKEPEKKEK